MDFWSNPQVFRPINGRKYQTNNYDVYHREQEQRILQVQAQQRCHQEVVSQRADRFLSAQKASSDAVKTRLGLSHGPPVVPHPPILCGSPRYSEKSNRTVKRDDWSDGYSLRPSVSVTPLSSPSSVNCSILPPLPARRESPQCSDKFRHRNTRADSYVSNFSPSASVTPLSSLSSVDTHTPDELKFVYPITPEPPLCESPRFSARSSQENESSFSIWSSVSITPLSSLSSVDTHTPDELRSVYPITPEPSFPLGESPRFSARSSQENESSFSIWSSVSITPLSSLSSVDTHTPDELRSVYPITPSPVPTPPPVCPKPKKSRLPVLQKRLESQSSQISVSKVKNYPRCPHCQQPWIKLELLGRALQPGQGDWLEECRAESVSEITVHAPAVVPAPPAVTPIKKYSSKTARIAQKAKEWRVQEESVSEITVQTPAVVPAPPAVTPIKKYSSKTARIAQKAKEWRVQEESVSEITVQTPAVVPAPPAVTPIKKYSSKTARIAQKAKERRVEEEDDSDYRPLHNPGNSLTLALELLESNDWKKKVDACKTIQSLVRHHQSAVLTNLREICLILTQELKSIRSCVACAAITAMTDLFIYLGALMDPEVEQTCRSLLLRLTQSNDNFIQERVGRALDALVENCSPRRVTVELLYTGTSHRCVAVRNSAAEHLKQVLDKVGAELILSAAKGFMERFLVGVAKMAVDAAPNVRCFGIQILMDIAKQKHFLRLWVKHVPERDQRPLDKFFKKLNLHTLT